MIETTSRKKATITGKPNVFCFENILKEHNLQPSDLLFVGDNLKTDIKFANRAGVDSFLVLTGVTRRESLKQDLAHDLAGVPTYIGEGMEFELTQ